jgi:UDP-N-acetylglucosamine:LPS N-acetylglucosamine transferase
VVVHDLLPGQEAGNLQFVREHGAVELAHGPRDVAQVVGELIEQPARREALAARGARLARPHAASEIAANLVRRLAE